MAQVAEEWDTLAPFRLKQILSGADITFNQVLLPALLNKLLNERLGNVLDAGCGIGVMTKALARYCSVVIGLDISRASIDIAVENNSDDISFAWHSIEQFARISRLRFDVIVSNMVLMDTPNVNLFLESAFNLTKPGGAFIFSITHPCFWPFYYGYSDRSWYDYNREIVIRSPFRISSEQDCRINSTHVHRPLSLYIDAISRAGFALESFSEPMPDEDVQALYPARWQFPRYALFKCRRARKFK